MLNLEIIYLVVKFGSISNILRLNLIEILKSNFWVGLSTISYIKTCLQIRELKIKRTKNRFNMLLLEQETIIWE